MRENVKRLEYIQQDGLAQAVRDLGHYGVNNGIKLDVILDDVEWLIGQAEENERLREALKFYANHASGGSIARKALEGLE